MWINGVQSEKYGWRYMEEVQGGGIWMWINGVQTEKYEWRYMEEVSGDGIWMCAQDSQSYTSFFFLIKDFWS